MRKIIEQHFIGGWWPTVQDDNGIIMGVEDSVPTINEVDIQRKLCNCGLWQTSGVPCPHACKCIPSEGENIDDVVDKMRTND